MIASELLQKLKHSSKKRSVTSWKEIAFFEFEIIITSTTKKLLRIEKKNHNNNKKPSNLTWHNFIKVITVMLFYTSSQSSMCTSRITLLRLFIYFCVLYTSHMYYLHLQLLELFVINGIVLAPYLVLTYIASILHCWAYFNIAWVSSARETFLRARCKKLCGYFLGLLCGMNMFGKSAT